MRMSGMASRWALTPRPVTTMPSKPFGSIALKGTNAE
jgi:hypothetical protein